MRKYKTNRSIHHTCYYRGMNRSRFPFYLVSGLATLAIVIGAATAREFQTPQALQSSSNNFGASLSASYMNCWGCASSEGNTIIPTGELSYALSVHDGGTLRLRANFSWNVIMGVSSGSHTDCPNYPVLELDGEYLLSSKGGWVGLIAGVSSEIALAKSGTGNVAPYLGGIFAFGDPGTLRPYVSARIGGVVYPWLGLYVGSSVGLEIPVTSKVKVLPEVFITVRAPGVKGNGNETGSSEQTGPLFVGGGIGLIF